MPAALAIGTAVGMIGAAKLNSNSANKSARLQTDAANHGADIQKQSADEALAFQREQAAQDQARWEASQRANYDQYVGKHNAANTLAQGLGFSLGDAVPYPQSQPSGGSGTPSGGVSGAGGTSGGSADALKALLDQGMDPQQAAAQFNKQFGRTTGNEAVYYDPSQHGGKATIGLPDAYLSLEGNGWSITPRSGGGAAPRSIAAAMPQGVAMPTPSVQPFQLRSINAFMRA